MSPTTRFWWGIVCALLASVVSLTGACGTGTGGEAARGRILFSANCALCHGQGGEGKPRLGKALLDNDFVKTTGDEELVEFLKVGRRADHPLNTQGVDMPPRGGNPGLSDEQLRLLVVYLRTLG